ncbi:MAG: T9SS type A sorting domain-containing protein, partial [Bacteroidetes bacterium]|nr:T9SS type A sorting domain-containing protein [Bacteroidota bacterium]
FDSNSNDSEGSPIQNGIPYKIFVLTIADGTNAIVNALSQASAAITLQSEAGAATNVDAADNGDTSTGEDLLVGFSKATDEAKVDHYRVIVVKTGKAPSFQLDDANNTTDYFQVMKTGNDISTSLDAATNDADGDAIVNGVAYKVFVLSIADGTIATVNSLSNESNEVILKEGTNVGMEQHTKEELIVLLDDKLIISNASMQLPMTLKVYSMDGREQISTSLSDSHAVIPLTDLVNGVYLVELSDGSSLIHRKIVK